MTRRTTVSHLLTRSRFRDWLEQREAGSCVGFANSRVLCPLAEYLSAHLDGAAVQVASDVLVPGESIKHLPRWAWEFERRVDLTVGGTGWATRQSPVSREDALRLLDNAGAVP